MFDENMVNNVEQAFVHLKRSIEMLNRAEHMHEVVMKNHDPENMYLNVTAQKSRDMVTQLWNVTLEAQDDLGWALESLLNGCVSTLEEEK
jgi:hypothetical protein